MRGLYGTLVALALALVLFSGAGWYANQQAEQAREKSRDDVVVFACLAIKYSDEQDIREAFLVALSELGHSCP